MSEPKYTRNDVIVRPSEGKEYKDKMVAGGNTPEDAEGKANAGRFYPLDSVFEDHQYPFKLTTDIGTETGYQCIVPKKEPAYEELQAEWIKENDLKVGDKVKVVSLEVKECFDYDRYAEVLTKGDILKVREIKDRYIGLDYSWPYPEALYVPYFCLEKVVECPVKVGDYFRVNKEDDPMVLGRIFKCNDIENGAILAPDPDNLFPLGRRFDSSFFRYINKLSFRPFNLSKKEERDQLRGKWIVNHDDGEHLVDGFGQIYNEWAFWGKTAKDLLENWTFMDTGLPVGVEVEE